MSDEQILQGIERVLRNGGYDTSRDGTRWNPEDLRYNAEFFLPVVKQAMTTPRRESGGQQQAAAEKPPVHTACDKWIAVERGAHGTRVIITEPARSVSPERAMWANLSPRNVGELIDALLTACPRGALFSAEAARPGQELRERVRDVAVELDWLAVEEREIAEKVPDHDMCAQAYDDAARRLRAALEDPR